MPDPVQNTKPKGAGGRPKKKASEKRAILHSVWLSEGEEKLLQAQMEKSGLSASELFRNSVLGGKLRIPKVRIAPAELMETLTDFKKKSSLILLLATRDRDFTAQEKQVLLGSSASMRTAIERLERSLFLSLEKADSLEELGEVLTKLKVLREDLLVAEKPLKSQLKDLERLLLKADQLLSHFYQYLKVQ